MTKMTVNLVALQIGLERGRLLKAELLEFCKKSKDVTSWKLFVLRNKDDKRLYIGSDNKPMYFWNRLYAVEAAKNISNVFVARGPDHYFYVKIHPEDPNPQNSRRTYKK